MQRRKMLVKLWNRESFAEVAPTLPALPGGCNVAAEVEAAAGEFTNEYVEVVAKVGYDPDNLLPKFQAMVDRTTKRESLLVGGDYKLKAPAQTEFNTMEVVGVYRLVDKVHWQLYTARKEILRRMGVVPDGTAEGETNERLGGKVLSTPRDDDEAGEDTLLAELTKLGSPGGDIHPIQAALDAVARTATTFVVAHRLTTVRSADQILVVDRGRVVERGTHDELVAKGGTYASLVARQLKGAGDDPASEEETNG